LLAVSYQKANDPRMWIGQEVTKDIPISPNCAQAGLGCKTTGGAYCARLKCAARSGNRDAEEEYELIRCDQLVAADCGGGGGHCGIACGIKKLWCYFFC
jgi:hypothetical protein